ncbi:S-layer homology domain-containing protein [Ruminococcus sp.]|uniref:S-layer homology domain-containing protein n=1 Tax=Ruminococcus sp. TaxID=41978 RepID=UPI0025EFC034|nr:S-layer homology domain-containing protein [Ruminococcus sp.]MBR1431528.1 S-layer homology domain-containing protein [Ruminococcus sp.]
MNFKRICALLLAVCLSAALAMPALAVGQFNDIPTEVRMEATASKTGENNYSITLVARMNMAESLARAAILGADRSALDRVRFICTLNLSEDIEIDWSNVEIAESSYSMTGYGTTFTYNGKDYQVYEFDSITRSGNNVVMTYKLTDECKNNIRYLGVDGAVNALRKEVIFSCAMDNVTASFADTRTASASVVVRGYNNDMTAATGSTKVYFDDEPEAEGTVTVLTENPKPGDKVDVVVDPAPGKKVTSIEVTDKDGNVIEYKYTGNGNFDFIMPEGDFDIEVKYDTAPYTPNDSGIGLLLNVDEHIPYVIGNDLGTFKPYDNVLRCEVAMMFYRLLRNPDIEITGEFKDVDDSKWYATAMKTLATLGIFKGYEGNVYPEAPMTRAEFASVCVRFATIEPNKKVDPFSDVTADHWGYEELCKAAAYGWIVGYNGKFYPDEYVNRSEACTIINRMLARPSDTEKVESGDGETYPDVVINEDWGYDAITEAATDHDTDMDYVFYTEDWTDVRGALEGKVA